MSQVDVLIAFPAPLEADAGARLADRLGALPGVEAVRAGRHRAHLLQIHYDPAATTAAHLLEATRGAGLDGRLIGG